MQSREWEKIAQICDRVPAQPARTFREAVQYHSSAAMGIPNAADSLAALESAVFADKTITPEEMLASLRENFERQRGPQVVPLSAAPSEPARLRIA